MDKQQKANFPLEIRDVEHDVAAEIMSLFTGEHCGFIRIGPKGYFMPKKYEQEAANIYNMSLRPSDIFVVTYPRSGTTWTQELVWLVANDLDYEKAAAIQLIERFPFLEFPTLFNSVTIKRITDQNLDKKDLLEDFLKSTAATTAQFDEMPSPRFIKTHLPFTLLPPALLDTTKVVFVARDPRDVAVSFYHHNRLISIHGYIGDFKTYWNYFIKGLIYYAPFWEYIKEGWERRHHPNMLFLFYEEISKDLPNTVRRVADFLGKTLTEQQIEKLCDHLHISNFKNNPSVNEEGFKKLGIINSHEQAFIRKGKAGGWRDYFDEEMTQQAEHWIADNLRGTDLRFPE